MPLDLFADEQQPAQGQDLFADEVPVQGAPQKQELMAEAQKRGLFDKPGILDYLLMGAEPVLTMATGAIAEPIAGIAGIAKTITSGPEAGTQTIEQVQEALTYQPRTEAGQRGMRAIGETLQPIIEPIGEAVQAVGDVAYKAGGPVAGAAAITALAAIPELLGLKGSRAAKKMLLQRTIPNIDISTAYDELGNLLPEIKQAVQQSGIPIHELSDILPERISETAIRETAEQVGEVAGKKFGQARATTGLAEMVRSSQEILDSADEFGLSDQMLASHSSGNPLYIAIEQGLKSVPGSQLAAQEKALVANLARKADDLILEFGGEMDKSLLSDRFRTQSKNIIEDLGDEAGKLYKEINLSIPRNTPVSADNIIRRIRESADELGGEKFLDPSEKGLLNALSPDANPTYARLDKFRKQIGQSLHKKSGPFKDADEGALKQLYKALAEDQKIAADANDVGELYDSARGLVVQRKGLEKQLVKVLGKELTGNISAKARPAMLALQKGDTKQFDELIKNIPEQLGKEERKAVFATALNDAFTQGSRAERSLSIPAFDDFMTGLQKNKVAKQRLADELGSDAMKRLDSFHKIIGGIRKAQKQEITTGRVTAVPTMLDEVDNITSRLYGTVKKVVAAEGVSASVGAPGVGTAGVLGAALAAKRTARSVAADQLLSSGKFQRAVNRKASGELDTTARIERAEREIKKLKAYREWEKSLDEKTLKDLSAVGVIGYLTGETLRGIE